MRVLTLLLVAVLAGSVQGKPAHAIALVGGTVVDVSAFGASTQDTRDAVVVVEDGRITAVGPRRSTVIPRGAEAIDATGRFIVPGLNDVFATINNQAYANAFLYMGVTGIVGSDEPGGRRGPLFMSGRPSPRIYKLDVLSGYDMPDAATGARGGHGQRPAPRSAGATSERFARDTAPTFWCWTRTRPWTSRISRGSAA
jgi:hypothetical protein